jgi:hypothetical protein
MKIIARIAYSQVFENIQLVLRGKSNQKINKRLFYLLLFFSPDKGRERKKQYSAAAVPRRSPGGLSLPE